MTPEQRGLALPAALNRALRIIPLDIPELVVDYYLIWHESRHRNPAMKRFRELLAQAAT